MNPVDATPLNSPSEHDLDEIKRSAEEARNIVLTPPDRSQIERYLNPPANTPHALEYAFHLLGDARGKRVLDLGCGHGENVVLLVERGANVVGIDLSPELVQLAERRMVAAGGHAELQVGSAYETGLPDESVDVVFCIALIHHLEIPKVRAEMHRVLRKGGYIILSEPIRFSDSYDRLRKMLPSRDNISDYEHPLSRAEFECMVSAFEAEGLRYFRLPIVPLVERALGRTSKPIRKVSAAMLTAFPGLRVLATTAVVKLTKI
jgi:SAM-dependent methyltransferase